MGAFLGFAEQVVMCKSKAQKELSKVSPTSVAQVVFSPWIRSQLWSEERGTGASSMPAGLRRCALHRTPHTASGEGSEFGVYWLCFYSVVCFPIHQSPILSYNTKVEHA